MSVNVGRAALDWPQEQWDRLDRAVHDEATRAGVAASLIPLVGPFPDVLTVSADVISPDSLAIDDTLFTICPWWDGPLLRQRIDVQLGEAAMLRPERWIWVHHAPPANSPTSWGGKRHFGDTELVQWIGQHQPTMVISGHVHQSPFIRDGSWFDRLGDTWVFNTGLQPGRPPTYVVIDTDAGRAFWLAAGQAQWIELDAPLRRPALPITDPPPWLTSLDRIADPSPAKPSAAAG